MNRRRPVFVVGSIAAILAGVWSGVQVAKTADRNTDFGLAGVARATAAAGADVGLAGPLGPQKLAALPSYFKRVTFAASELSQYQGITAHLPAGKYLVLIVTKGAPGGRRPDCLGVSFPLAPSIEKGRGFRGYVSVAADGDAATVLCYERAVDTRWSVTYELFYFPTKLAG